MHRDVCRAPRQAEVERRVLVHKLAHVVREHQAVVEAMPDIAEPPPAGSVSNAMQVDACRLPVALCGHSSGDK